MRFPRVGESMNGILPSGRKDVPFRRTARRPNPIKIPRERNTRKRVRLYLESKRRERRKVRLEKTVAVCEKWAAESAMKFHETLLYFILILTSLILYIYTRIFEYFRCQSRGTDRTASSPPFDFSTLIISFSNCFRFFVPGEWRQKPKRKNFVP